MPHVNLLDHQDNMLEELLEGKTPPYPNANAVEIIKAVREQISESNNLASHNLLTKTKQLIGSQKIAINAHAELTSFVLAEQMSNNLATEVATLNTTITESVDSLRDKLLTTVDGVEYIGGPNKLFTGIFKGCIDGTLHGSVTVLGEGSECTLEGEANGNTFVVNPALANPGQLDNVAIGAHVPLAGTFTDVTVNGSLTVGTENIVTKIETGDALLQSNLDAAVQTLNGAIQVAKEGLSVKRFVDFAVEGTIETDVMQGISITDGTLVVPQVVPLPFLDAFTTFMDQDTFVTNLVQNGKSVLIANITGFDGVWVYSSTDDVNSTFVFVRRDDSDFNPVEAEEVKPGAAYPCRNVGTYIVNQVNPDNQTMALSLHTSTSNQISGALQAQLDTLKSAVNAILNLMGEQSVDTDNNVVVGEVHPQV